MYDFKQIEEEARKLVKKEDIKKAVADDAKRKRLFSFLEGPPTANAPPALHHLEVRTYKDIINKFRYMQGYNVPRKAGWDCHGLPVEVQMEKKLGLKNKKDILKYGEEKFIKECRESVFSYIKDWDRSTERMGYWIDLENPYRTLDTNYIESVWWSLKQLYGKKLLYEDHKVVPFCPRCETPLSSHEVAQGYKKITEDSIVVKFKLKGKGEYFLVWTTTPWTLPANLAIAVNPALEYVYIKGKETFIIAKELANKFFENPKIIKTIKGKELVGLKYEPLMPYFKNEKAFVVIGGDFVAIDEGTGLVHMAPAFGEADYDACRKEKLPFVQPVDETGKFTSEVPDYAGKFIKSADREITEKLEKEGKLFSTIKYEHDYPFCWRCNSPLMYYAIKSWFVKVTACKSRLVKLNEKTNWVPKHIKEGRFGEWLENVKDWALSRKKFWGTPLPVWRCECGNEEIIGSIEELKKKSVKKISDKEIDLHKPWIDDVKLKCKCGKEMSRVPDVIDCWYDSGSASFAQFHYPFENKKEFEKRFPYDFIAEAIDQTRGWFYVLHAIATTLFDDVAYENVICAGHIVDEKGEKMSKSKGNILNPDNVMDTIGVDATRLQFCIMDIGDTKRFGINSAREMVLPFLNILWNTYQYYTQLNLKEAGKSEIEDKWILSKLNSAINSATENLENYCIEKALLPVMDFVSNDFSRTYIKMVRERSDKNVKKICGEVLDCVSKLLAPYAPNITEVIHKEFGKQSVNLCEWPKANEKMIDKKLEDEFALAMQVIEKALAARSAAAIGVRWPLASLSIKADKKLSKELQEIIMRQVNVKKIIFAAGKTLEVELDTKLTPELEAEGYSREVTRAVQDARKKANLTKDQKISLVLVLPKQIEDAVKKHLSFLKEKTNAKSADFAKKKSKYDYESSVSIKGKEIQVAFIIL
jgi:isoleucyl-tRNA synthetase